MSKRILYIGNKLAGKGATVTSIETLGRFLEQEGYQLKVASSFRNKGLRLVDMLWTTLANKNWADKVLIDTYSTQNFLYAEAVAWLCRRLKLDYIPILRGGDLPNRLAKDRKRVSRLIDGAAAVVAPSAYLHNAFTQAGFTNLIHIPNTIAIDRYPYRERRPLHPKLLWVRSFHKTYNPAMALTVLERLLPEYPNAQLCMIGPDKDGSLEACQQIAKRKDLPVQFTGKMEKSEWIRHADGFDIFINTTNFDNTPVSVMEAMALGLPVVSTDVGGMPFLIANGTDGTLVPPKDPEAFVSALKELLKAPDKALEMATLARRKATTFDWQVVKEQWFELLGPSN